MSIPHYERVPLGAGKNDVEMSVRVAKPTAESDESAVMPLFMQRRPWAKFWIGWFILALVVVVVFAFVSTFEPTWIHNVAAEKIEYEADAADEPRHSGPSDDGRPRHDGHDGHDGHDEHAQVRAQSRPPPHDGHGEHGDGDEKKEGAASRRRVE